MTGKGVGKFKDKELDELGGEFDKLTEKRADLSEKLTAIDTQCVERMKKLKISVYHYDDREMRLAPGKDHVKTKKRKGDNGSDSEDDQD